MRDYVVTLKERESDGVIVETMYHVRNVENSTAAIDRSLGMAWEDSQDVVGLKEVRSEVYSDE